jgi:hypothetical protein
MNELLTTNDTSVGHSEFNLEWAKRGGVLRINKTVGGFVKLIRIDTVVETDDIGYFGHLIPKVGNSYGMVWSCLAPFDKKLVMATKEECESAGVEYIAPPNQRRM